MNVMRSAHCLAYHYRTNRKCILALQLIAIIIFCKLQESAFIVSNEALAHPFFTFDFFNTQKAWKRQLSVPRAEALALPI